MKLRLIVILFYYCVIGLSFNIESALNNNCKHIGHGTKGKILNKGLDKIDLKDPEIVRIRDNGDQLNLHLELQGLTNIYGIEKLEIDGKKITKFPRVALFLQNNQLTKVPKEIGKLKNLVSLALKNNQLTSLPDIFNNFPHLEFLGLGNNQLKTLPNSIGDLTGLHKLILKNNKLQILPNTFKVFPNLKHLSLTGNQLIALPESFGNLTGLIKFDFPETLSPDLIMLKYYGKLPNLKEVNKTHN